MATKSMEGRMVKMETDISYIKESQQQTNEDIKKIHQKLDNFIDCAPNKFADKKTEERVSALEKDNQKSRIWIATIAGGSIVAFYIIQIVLKKIGLI